MKRILLTILFTIIGCFVFGQNGISLNGTADYKFTIDGYQGEDPKACGDIYGLRELNLYYEDGSVENLWKGRIWNQNFNHEKLYTKDKKITGIQIYSINKWWVFGVFNVKFCNARNDDKITLPVNRTCYSKFYQNPLHVTRDLTIKSYPIYSIIYNNGEEYTLGSNQNLKIALPDNLNSYDYVWKYSIEGGIPNIFPDSYNQKSILNIPASEFVPEDNYGKIISVWVESSCSNGANKSNKFKFIVYKSSPQIISHEVSETRCFNTKDGILTLHFDRKLDKGETLSLSLENKSTGTVVVNKNITSYLHSGTSYTLENLPPGEYRLNVHGTYNGNSTYTDGEKHSIDFEIEKATPVSFQLSSKTDVYCFEGNDGVINIEAKGGTGKYQYLITKDGKNYLDWTDFNNANKTSINALSKGIYKIKVRDTHECVAREPNDSSLEKEIEITISQPNAPISLIDKEIEIVQPTGYGLSNGYISVMVQGGTPKSDGSYHYEWRKDSPTGTLITTGITTRVSNNSYTIKISNLTAGKYYLTVKDKNYNAATTKLGNCGIVSKEFEVTQPDPLKAEIEILQDISCNISNEYPFKLDLNQNGIPDNAEDGKIEAKVTGGVGTYSYQWQKLDNGIFIDISGATAPVLKNIKAGTYKILVIDKNKNKVEEKIVTTYPPKFELSMFANSISCNNESSGRVSVKATGGTGAYSYEWNTMDTTSEVTGLRAGNYFVLVTDAKNCKIKGAAEVTQPDQIVITDEEVRNPICHNASNGSIKIKISGGTKPYKISWSNGVTTEENSNLSAGNYVLTVTDAKGCQEIKEYKLTNPEPLRVHIGEDVTLCAGDTQRYDATIDDKGASYLWRNEKGEIISKLPTIELSDAGVYTVTVTDSKGCIGTDRVVIKKSNEILEPKFMLTTHAYTESTVVLVNTSPKMPETVEWLIPDNSAVSVIEKNEEYLELKFSNTGSYRIGLKGMQGQCKKTFYKEVVVEENLSGVDLSSDKISNITEFNVAPNPNDGNFKVIVKLEKENPINLRIINMLTQQAYPVITKPKSTYFLVPYHVTLSTGVYFVILETGNESMVKKMIIK